MMEIERLKSLRAEDEKDIQRKAALRVGADHIMEQIADRHRRRMIDQEILNREKQ